MVLARVMVLVDKGLFINDVIIFGRYRDPPPPLVITCHFSATPTTPTTTTTTMCKDPTNTDLQGGQTILRA